MYPTPEIAKQSIQQSLISPKNTPQHKIQKTSKHPSTIQVSIRFSVSNPWLHAFAAATPCALSPHRAPSRHLRILLSKPFKSWEESGHPFHQVLPDPLRTSFHRSQISRGGRPRLQEVHHRAAGSLAHRQAATGHWPRDDGGGSGMKKWIGLRVIQKTCFCSNNS